MDNPLDFVSSAKCRISVCLSLVQTFKSRDSSMSIIAGGNLEEWTRFKIPFGDFPLKVQSYYSPCKEVLRIGAWWRAFRYCGGRCVEFKHSLQRIFFLNKETKLSFRQKNTKGYTKSQSNKRGQASNCTRNLNWKSLVVWYSSHSHVPTASI